MSLLALRSKISLAVAISPVAIWETIATTMIGIRQISTLRKISASSRMMSSDRREPDDEQRLVARLLLVVALGDGAGHAVLQVAGDGRLELGAQRLDRVEGRGVVAGDVVGEADDGELDQAVLRGRLGLDAGERLLQVAAAHLVADAVDHLLDLRLVVGGQLAAVLAVEDDDRADLAGGAERLVLEVEGLDRLVVVGQELGLVLGRLERRREADDGDGEDDPGGDDVPGAAGGEATERTEHASDDIGLTLGEGQGGHRAGPAGQSGRARACVSGVDLARGIRSEDPVVPGRGSVRPSWLEVVTHSEPSGARATERIRP